MPYITKAQRQAWTNFFYEEMSAAIREGSLDDILKEVGAEVRQRQKTLREKENSRTSQRRTREVKPVRSRRHLKTAVLAS